MLFGLTLFSLLALVPYQSPDSSQTLKLNDLEYFETRGLNVLVFSNWYNDLFLPPYRSIAHHCR